MTKIYRLELRVTQEEVSLTSQLYLTVPKNDSNRRGTPGTIEIMTPDDLAAPIKSIYPNMLDTISDCSTPLAVVFLSWVSPDKLKQVTAKMRRDMAARLRQNLQLITDQTRQWDTHQTHARSAN